MDERTPLRDWEQAASFQLDIESIPTVQLGKKASVEFGDVASYRNEKRKKIIVGVILVLFASAIISLCIFGYQLSQQPSISTQAAWSSRSAPFSTVDPRTLGFVGLDRPAESSPGNAFEELIADSKPLPTNSWYENLLLGVTTNNPENKVFQVPYILDTAGRIPGVRTFPSYVQSNSRAVMVRFDFFICFFYVFNSFHNVFLR
jgi:hypothetical protein